MTGALSVKRCICGDGGFQMTAQALSTMAHCGSNPIVVIIDNGIYAYEQYLLDLRTFGARPTNPDPMRFLTGGTS